MYSVIYIHHDCVIWLSVNMSIFQKAKRVLISQYVNTLQWFGDSTYNTNLRTANQYVHLHIQSNSDTFNGQVEC